MVKHFQLLLTVALKFFLEETKRALDPKGDWIDNGEHLWHHSYTRPAKGTTRQKQALSMSS